VYSNSYESRFKGRTGTGISASPSEVEGEQSRTVGTAWSGSFSLLEKIKESNVNAPITLPILYGCTSATGAFYRIGTAPLPS
jgi:hypothetical protein